jgi:hypothetical protein
MKFQSVSIGFNEILNGRLNEIHGFARPSLKQKVRAFEAKDPRFYDHARGDFFGEFGEGFEEMACPNHDGGVDEYGFLHL